MWRSTVAREAPSNEQNPQPSPSPSAHLLRTISTSHGNRATALQHVQIKHGPRPILIPSTSTTLRHPRNYNLDSRPSTSLGPDRRLALRTLQPPTRVYDHNSHSILPCTHFYHRADRCLPRRTGRGLLFHKPRRLQPRPRCKGPSTTKAHRRVPRTTRLQDNQQRLRLAATNYQRPRSDGRGGLRDGRNQVRCRSSPPTARHARRALPRITLLPGPDHTDGRRLRSLGA